MTQPETWRRPPGDPWWRVALGMLLAAVWVALVVVTVTPVSCPGRRR